MDDDDDYYYYPPDWSALVSEWGYQVLDSRFCGQWQGDYVALLRDGDRLGLAVIGYGSCSGCDALQACETEGEVLALSEAQRNNVRWLTPADFVAYVDEWKAQDDWYWHEKDVNEFLVELAGRYR